MGIPTIHKEIADELISKNLLHDITSYLEGKKISKKEWPKIFSELVKNKDKKISNTLNWEIQQNVNDLLEDVENFIFLLSTLADNGYNLSTMNVILSNIKINHPRLCELYKKINKSSHQILRQCGGTVLGLIGRKSSAYMFREMNFETSDNDDKKRISVALYMASFKPFRDQNFKLSESVFDYIIKSLSSEDNELSYYAVLIAIRLFDLDHRLLSYLEEYIDKSDTTKGNFLNAIYIEWLYYNRELEVSLIIRCSNTQSLDVIRKFLAVSPGKLHDEYIDIKFRQILQKRCLELIKKYHSVKDFIRPHRDSYLLDNVCKVDPIYTLTYAVSWITGEDIDPIKHRFEYPILFYTIFQNHENQIAELLGILSQHDRKFDIMINGILEELILDLRPTFDSEFTVFNKTIVSELTRLLENNEILAEIESLKTKNLDDIPSKMSSALEIIKQNQLNPSNPNYRTLENKKKELADKMNFFSKKNLLLSKCSKILIQLCSARGLNYTKLTRNYRGVKLASTMTSCEILRNNVFNENIEQIHYTDIEYKLDWFPNIKKYLGNKWLLKKCNEGFPYHWIVSWLSKALSQEEQNRWIIESDNEIDDIRKENLNRAIMRSIRAVDQLSHVDKYLDYFNNGNPHGKKTIINGLKEEDNFFQFLSQLEIAIKFRDHGYNVDLEVPSINGRSIDVVAKKDGNGLIFELATLDMYNELKYSRFSANVPDRPKSIMLSKLKQISDYAVNLDYPIIIVFNLTHAVDADLFGIAYSLNGGNVGHFGMVNGEFVNEYTTFERDPEFLALQEGKKLSAVIYYYSKFSKNEIKFEGDIIHNKTADKKLDKKTTDALNSVFFD